MAAQRVFKSHYLNLIIVSLFILGFIAFESWDHYFPLPVRDRNQREIERIKVDPSDFSFAVLGDHKGHEFVFEPLLRDIEQDKGIALAVELGDLVRQGRRWFYRRLLDQIEKDLISPFLAVIGNHDLYRGSANYRQIFGPTHFSFQIGESDFIFLDTSARFHFASAQRQWLERELQRSQASKARFVFMHVPLFDPREGRGYKCLSEKDGKDLLDLFKRYNVTHLFASHIHGYFSGRWEGIPYTITGGAGAGLHGEDPQHFFHHYVKVRVSGAKVDMEVRRIDVQKSSTKDFLSFMKDFGPEWGLLAGMLISLIALALSIKKEYGKTKRPV